VLEGAPGIAISFCDASERPHLRAIEKLIKQPLSVVGAQPDMSVETPVKKAKPHSRKSGATTRKRRRRSRHTSRQAARL
jgi:ATP-dependent RNA helicase RhlE